MKKILLCLIILCIQHSVMAKELVTMKITPDELISTKKEGNVELGDTLKFKTARDVYVNDTLYIKKDVPVYAFVGYVHPNGFAGDSAQIKLERFVTKTVDGKKLTINNPLTITGNMSFANHVKQTLGMRISTIFVFVRGAEIYLEPDKHIFNVMFEKN